MLVLELEPMVELSNSEVGREVGTRFEVRGTYSCTTCPLPRCCELRAARRRHGTPRGCVLKIENIRDFFVASSSSSSVVRDASQVPGVIKKSKKRVLIPPVHYIMYLMIAFIDVTVARKRLTWDKMTQYLRVCGFLHGHFLSI